MYSSVADMSDRFGAVEMARLTTPSGQELAGVVEAPVTRALVEASALIDSYVRRRYATPIATPLPEIIRAAAVLARYDLAHGDDRQPSEQMLEQRREVIAWLKDIRDGTVLLDLDEAPTSDESYATVQTRDAAYGDPTLDNTGYFNGAAS
jgi:phage gp36-like protein